MKQSETVTQGTDFGVIYGSGRVTQAGEGTLALANNNTYSGGTYVSDGTLLANNVSGSATGSGSVYVGYAEISGRSGTGTTGSKSITGVADTSGLIVGQEIFGAGIAAGTVITNISGTTVTMSNGATGDLSSFSQVGATGTLGGTGTIRPVRGNSIQVASGSSVAPGASIGTLTLDGDGTASALLLMESGATFDFELDGDGSVSDKLRFWNYASGDLVLNSTVLNVSLLSEASGPGEYTVNLFEFFSDGGSTITGSGLTGGLVLNLGEGVSGGSLNYNGGTGSIDLTYTVVPEPSAFGLVAGMMGLALLARRRGRAA